MLVVFEFVFDEGVEDKDVSTSSSFPLKSEHAETMDQINKTGDYDSAIEEAFRLALDRFVKTQTW